MRAMQKLWLPVALVVFSVFTNAFGQRPSLPAPQNLKATTVSSSEIDLAWSDVSTNETGFRIEHAAAATGPWSLLARVGSNIVAFANTGLPASNLNFYRVRAFTPTLTSRWSNIASNVTQAAGPPPETIGYIGASVTIDCIDGYTRVGGTRFWPQVGTAYNGGGIAHWAGSADQLWPTFDSLLAQFPDTKTIWWQLVTRQQDPADNFSNALLVLDLLHQRIPDAVVYVSAEQDYSGGHVCPNGGADGATRMQAVADQLVAGGFVLPGPLMGPLSPTQLRDDCHANPAGKTLLGTQLKDFFQ